jgi:hypothetical protein
MLIDWMMVGEILEMNPAFSVRGSKYVTKKQNPGAGAGKAQLLLDSIDVTELLAGAFAMIVTSKETAGSSGCVKKAANTTK